MRGAEAAARARGYNVLISDSAGSIDQQERCLAMLAERRVDGLLIAPIHAKEDELAAVRDAGLKIVLVNSTAGDDVVSSVGADNVRGGHLATQHLLALGHHRIGFLGDLSTIPSVQERLAGYQMAHAQARVAVDKALVIEDLADPAAVRAAVQRLLALPQPPTALFAVNDQFAMVALQALTEQRCRVPEDMALVGYGDIPVAAWLSVALTSVAQPKEEQGAISATLLINQIENPRLPVQRVILPPRLVVRHSCGATRMAIAPNGAQPG